MKKRVFILCITAALSILCVRTLMYPFPPRGTGTRAGGAGGDLAADGVTAADAAPPFIRDRLAERKAVVLKERSVPDPDRPATRRLRERLVRVDGFKYPLIRVTETVEDTGAGEVLRSQLGQVADHVMVRLRPGVADETAEARLAELGATVRRRLPLSRLWLVAWAEPEIDTLPRALALLAQESALFEIAEADSIVHKAAVPNDARFGELWGMHNTGQSAGAADMDVDAAEAWDTFTGTRNVTVGVIDTGVDLTHPDLAANAFVNAAEAGGAAGVDDDANGYIDDVSGWDFAYNDRFPTDVDTHGTHCAGTIAASGNNGTGVAGVCWQAKILPAKFLDDSGSGATSDAVEAVIYCTRMGCFLTSNSWGGGAFSQTLLDAINAAHAAGVLFVNASGNDSYNLESVTSYPAAYRRPNMIVVASITRTGSMSTFSNYGASTVHIGAPGSEILSTMPGGGYQVLSGTSMACPHVAGAVALVKSYKPSLTAAEVRDIILRTADATPSLLGRCSTSGRLNAARALAETGEMSVLASTNSVSGRQGGPFTPASWTWTVANNGSTPITWAATGGPSWLSYSPASGGLAAGASGTVNVQLTAAAASLSAGIYNGTVEMRNVTSGVVRTVETRLEVEGAASLPFTDGFESALAPYWRTSGTGPMRTVRTTTPAGRGGSGNCVLMDAMGSGTYARNEFTLTVDLSGVENAMLSFWVAGFSDDFNPAPAGPFTGGADFDGVAISADGVTWHPVHTFSGLSSVWAQVTLNLDELAAAKGLTYTPTFKIRFNQYDNYEYLTDGIAVDDVTITGTPARRLNLAMAPAELTEGAASGTLTVSRPSARAEDVTVTLSSDPEGQVTLPATVTLPSGQSAVTVMVPAVEDGALDGTRSVRISAAGIAGALVYEPGSVSVPVHDAQTAALSVALPASAAEGSGVQAAAGMVSVSEAPAADVTVALSSSRAEVRVPGQVTIPAGQTSTTFDVEVLNNQAIEDARQVSVTASVQNWTPGTAAMTVTDDESRQLSVILLPAEATEGDDTAPVNGGTVRMGGTLTVPLQVTLTSASTGDLTLPLATVTIPAGQREAAFAWQVVNDALTESTEEIGITAEGASLTGGTGFLRVYDDDNVPVPHAPRPDDGAAGQPLDTDLAWQCGGDERMTDGGFESGTLAAWTRTGAESSFLLNDGSVEPPGPEPGVPPHTGAWSLIMMAGPSGTAVLGQTVQLPVDGPLPRLRWMQRVRNLAASYSATQRCRVTVQDLDTAGALPVEIFATGAGDPLLQDWTTRQAELRGLRGRRVRIAFEVTAGSGGGMHLHLDNISIDTGNGTPLTWEVRIGTTADLSGVPVQSVSERALALPQLAPDTHYWWQVTSIRGAERVSGPVWEFQVPAPGSLAAFRFGPVAGPVRLGVPFPVTIEAVDGFGNVLPGYTGSAPFAAGGPQVSPVMAGPFVAGVWSGEVTLTGSPGQVTLRLDDGAGISGASLPFTAAADGTLTLQMALGTVREGDPTVPVAGIVSASIPPLAPVTVTIIPQSGGEIQPVSVTLAAGESVATFPLTAADDALLDGTQSAVLRATAPGYAEGISSVISVDDNEAGVLTLTAPPTVNEADASLTSAGRVALSAPAGRDIRISLTSSDTSEITVPAMLTIPAGADSAAFDVTAVQDTLADRTQAAVLRASVPGWPAAFAVVNVADDESTALTLLAPAVASEEAVTLACEVSLGGLVASPTVISLASSDISEVRVPATVTVPAGRSSAAFTATVIDDTLPDGVQNIEITASAPFFTGAAAQVTVADNDAHSFSFSPVADHQVDHSPFTVTITARDLNGAPIPSYTSTLSLSVTGSSALTVVPASISMTGGTWTGQVTVHGYAPDVRLGAASGPATGQSAPFVVDEDARLAVTQASLSASVLEGGSETQSLQVANTGGSLLDWTLKGSGAGTPLTVYAQDLGWYDATGLHTSTNGNYLCGRYVNTSGVASTYNNWFVFSLPAAAADAASVSLVVPAGTVRSDQGTETWELHHVSTPAVTLRTGGTGLVSIYQDLGDGAVYGGRDLLVADTGSSITVPLNSAGLAAASAAAGTAFAIGGTLPSLSTAAVSEYLFGNTDAIGVALIITPNSIPAWLSITPKSGSLAAGGALDLGVTFNSAGLQPGNYTTTLTFVTSDWRTPEVNVPVSFTVRSGVRSFTFDPLPPAVPAGEPMDVTIQARALDGTVAAEFTGMANITTSLNPADRTIGTPGLTSTAIVPAAPDFRTTFLVPASALGGAGKFRSLSLDFLTAGRELPQWTIRLKQTSATSLTPVWDAAGWTEVFRSTVNITAAGWREFVFDAAYDYSGTSSLIVDLSCDGMVTAQSLAVQTSSAAALQMITGNSTSLADPRLWSGNIPPASSWYELPRLRLGAESGLVQPGVVGPFLNGVWTGQLTPMQTAAQFAFKADDGAGHRGTSGFFAVTAAGAVTLEFPATVNEGSTTTGTLRLSAAQPGPVSFQFESRLASVTVPAQVTVPAGDTSATFSVSAAEDEDVRGPVDVSVRASAPRFEAGTGRFILEDNDQIQVTLSTASALSEGAASLVQFTASRSALTPLTWTLTQSPPGRLSVPATVVLPAGQTSASFYIVNTEDDLIQDTQNITLTAALGSWVPGTTTVSVLDNEPRTLFWQALPASAPETTAVNLSVSLAGTVPAPLTITVTSSSPRFPSPAILTVPVGSSTATATVMIPDDGITAAPEDVTLTASAPGFTGLTGTIRVADTGLASLQFSAAIGAQVAGRPFTPGIIARNALGGVWTYDGVLSLSAKDSAGASVALTPSTVPLTGGMATPALTLGRVATGVQLTATYGSVSGNSSTFDVSIGPAASVVWAAPASAPAGTPFRVHLAVKDLWGNTVPSFTGSAALSIVMPSDDRVVGSPILSIIPPLGTGYMKHRTEMVLYPAEVGGPGLLQSVGLNVTTPPGASLQDCVIRVKHTDEAGLWGGAWDNDGWTEAFRGAVTITGGGRKTIPFTVPFAYDGLRNLKIQLSYDNPAAASWGRVQGYTLPDARVQIGYTNDFGVPHPADWVDFPYPVPIYDMPVLILGFNAGAPGATAIQPSTAGPFVGGEWSGLVWLDAPGSSVVRASILSPNVAGDRAITVTPVQDSADTDGDGLTNLMERAYYLDHAAADALFAAPGFSFRASDGRQLLQWRRRKGAGTGFQWSVQRSTDLLNWTTLSGLSETTVPGSDGMTETVTSVLPIGTGARALYRVRVTVAP